MSYAGVIDEEVTVLHECVSADGQSRVTAQAGAITAQVEDPLGNLTAITPAVVEIGTTGLYNVSFAPTSGGNWLMTVTNPEIVADGMPSAYVVTVEGAALLPAVTSDSYCATADVIARVQYLAAFTATSVPTTTQALNFMARRAAILFAEMHSVIGDEAPGPTNYDVIIDTSTDAGVALERVLVHYNAIGAAIDCLEAAGANETPARSEKIAELYTLWTERTLPVQMAADLYDATQNAASTATHISVGEITQTTTSSRVEEGITFDGETKW